MLTERFTCLGFCGALHCAVDGGTRDSYERRYFRDNMVRALHEPDEVPFLRGESFDGLPRSRPRDRHAFARPPADEVCFELGGHAQHVE